MSKPYTFLGIAQDIKVCLYDICKLYICRHVTFDELSFPFVALNNFSYAYSSLNLLWFVLFWLLLPNLFLFLCLNLVVYPILSLFCLILFWLYLIMYCLYLLNLLFLYLSLLNLHVLHLLVPVIFSSTISPSLLSSILSLPVSLPMSYNQSQLMSILWLQDQNWGF